MMIRRRVVYSLFFLVLASLVFIPQVYAATFVGYAAANQGASTCGINCSNTGATTNGIGEAVSAPFNGQLFSVGIFTGSGVPNKLVIMNQNFVGTPATTSYACSGGATCFFQQALQSYGVVDVETLSGLTANAFNTVNLANAVTVNSGQFVSIVIMNTANGAAAIGMLCGASCGNQCPSSCTEPTVMSNVLFCFGVTTPQGNFNTGGATCNSGSAVDIIVGASFIPASGSVGTTTQCVGNCGTPPVTLANTNSTHSINFNQTQTLFYEFQSNLNGFLLNVTVNIAKTYSNGQQVALGIWTTTCGPGITPFSSTCPGQQRFSIVSGPNIVKGKFSGVPVPIAVNNGQWIAIGVSAFVSGLDLNDTNTNVPLFFQLPGAIPPVLNSAVSASSLCSGCKMGLWAFINGNTIVGPPSFNPPFAQCGADLICVLTGSVLALTPSNPLIGAMLMGIIYSIITTFGLIYVSYKFEAPIPGGVYVILWTSWMTFFAILVGQIWFVVFEILILIVIFSGIMGNLHTGNFSSRGRSTA